jgi:hypothetical protein
VHALEVALPRQGDERRAVEVRVGHRRHQVEGAGPEGAQADAGAAGQATVDVRHVGAALLVAHRHELDGRVLQGLVQIECLLARDTEDVRDPLGLEALDEDVRGLALGHLGATYPAQRFWDLCR